MGTSVQILICLLALSPSTVLKTQRLRPCGEPNAINDSTYTYKGIRHPDGRFNEGATATYTCNKGFTKGLDSNDTATCQSGSWKGVNNFRCCRVNICIDSNLHCTLPYVDGATLSIVSGNDSFILRKNEMGYGIGTAIRYDCLEDYELRNDSTNGLFTCTNGGKWSPDKFTKCYKKECSPPPKIANGRLRYPSSTYYVGSIVPYDCDSGYEIGIMKHGVCNSKLQWVASLGIPDMPTYNYFYMAYPNCKKTYVYDSGISYPSGGSSGGTSYGSGTSTKTTNDYTYKSKKKEWSPLKTIFVIIVVLFAGGLCTCALISNSGDSSRSRAVIVDGVTTTYVGGNTYVGTPPRLTAGQPTFSPSRTPMIATYSPNYGHRSQPAPSEMIPLEPLAPIKPDEYQDAPPNYEEAMRTSGTGTAPSAPYL